MFKSRGQKKDKSPEPARTSEKTVREQSVHGRNQEIEISLVKSGFARKGDLIAVVHPPVHGKEGRNVHGEPIPAKQVKIPSLIAGMNVRVKNVTSYFMNVNGIVEVMKDSEGCYRISGKLYRHGGFGIDLSDDEMTAFLTVTPSFGGAPAATVEEVLDQCRDMGISVGVNETSIRKTVVEANEKKNTVENVPIAQGKNPVHGEDGTFEYRVRLASGSRFALKADGRIDFKDSDLITRVKKDELIAVRRRAQEGVENGKTVRGGVIKAAKGQDVDVEAGTNIRVEEKDGVFNYYSRIDGQLLIHENILSVEPLMVIKGDVGPETGNIDFNGSLAVLGNINDGYRVRAGKDITVQGNVGSAYLQSGGSIMIKNGVIGKYKGLVSAKGDITFKFAENSNIQAVGDMIIQRAALNCKLLAGGRVISTEEKGHVVGGEIKARGGLEVKVLGNDSEAKMSVAVGTDFFLENRIIEMRQKVETYEQSLGRFELLLGKLKRAEESCGELSDSLKNVYTEARKKSTIIKLTIDNLKKKERDFFIQFNEIQDSEVVVYESLHKGVKIQFGKAGYEPETTRMAVKVFYDHTYRKIAVANL